LVLVFRERTGVIVASGCGKVENLPLVFHFSMAAKPGGGNVGISRFLRDSQGTVERVGNPSLVFRAFHGPGISTALGQRNFGNEDVWQCRSNLALAALIRRAHSVSLMASARFSNSGKLKPGFKKRSASGSDWSFSKGVR
jgi:hypothetical protein